MGQRPGGRNLTPPDYARPAPALPGRPPPSLESPLSSQERVFVRRFELTGNTVFTREELTAVTAPYENRVLSAEELQEARRQLTLYYVERGYLNSGAVIPDQQVEGWSGSNSGRRRPAVRGRDHRQYASARRLSPGTGYKPDAGEPLNVQHLQERLQLLQQNPLIEQLQAELAPGVQPGKGDCGSASARLAPTKSAWRWPTTIRRASARHELTCTEWTATSAGSATPWELSYGHSLESRDTSDWRVFYARPLNARDTTVQIWAERNDTSVIEDRFSASISPVICKVMALL